MKWMLAIAMVVGMGGAAVFADGAATAPATQGAAVVDVKNTKCMVATDDDIDPTITSIYQGKLYHFCCKGCKGEFDLHPEKYVKDFEANPAKYGVKP